MTYPVCLANASIISDVFAQCINSIELFKIGVYISIILSLGTLNFFSRK